ncbi:glutamate-1-semialdehyde 2,1-aminomutase [Candidatus Methanomassiliicoccus intestinalis]|uniref:glutamate-1-semialdehyde 2,1-aminomutase n=1 Tax=Candidatus Methanomassiliicoccus intestinalis TaxID=1406512 RepID=UPI0037DC2CD9
MNSKRSQELYEKSSTLLPGGVSSPVRAFKPYPRFIKYGKGSRIYDVDDNEYIDYCMAFGPLILGHANNAVAEAVSKQVFNGTIFGAPSELEIDFAELICKHFPSIEMLRPVSTGTEATMHAIRLARGYTGRKKIIKMEGGFHGAHDTVLVKAGSGALTHSVPNSAGIPEESTKNTILVPFNDLNAIEEAFKANPGEIAALITEPVMGNTGPILPKDGYLQGLRELTTANDALLIFDEVITGFRLSLGGAQKYFAVQPDITTLGKIVGGGLPIGVFGASSEIMSSISPSGPVYQAGTFAGNPLSMCAGITTIKSLEKINYDDLNSLGELMRTSLGKVAQELKIPHQVQGIGSLFQMFLTAKPVENYADALTCDSAAFMKLFHGLLDEGIYIPPSQYETSFVSTAHTSADVEKTAEAFAKVMSEVLM